MSNLNKAIEIAAKAQLLGMLLFAGYWRKTEILISPPERKPWGAYSFWFLDPDGNKIAVAQKREEK